MANRHIGPVLLGQTISTLVPEAWARGARASGVLPLALARLEHTAKLETSSGVREQTVAFQSRLPNAASGARSLGWPG
eukprot:12898596-Prorocentrum_lima.AAC.1